MFRLAKKLKLLKKDCREFNKKWFSNIFFRVDAKKIEYDAIHESMIGDGGNEILN